MPDENLLRSLADRLSPEVRTYETPILNERQRTHGDFESNARCSQRFRSFLRAEPGWDRLSDIQRQSFDEMVLKMARILSGDSNFIGHWEDLVGYPQLVVEALNAK